LKTSKSGESKSLRCERQNCVPSTSRYEPSRVRRASVSVERPRARTAKNDKHAENNNAG